MKIKYIATIIGIGITLSLIGIWVELDITSIRATSNEISQNPEAPHIDVITITGLNQTYEINQPINAIIDYAGYWNNGDYPDVRILDTNGTQIWSNSLAHTESPALTNSTFSYVVQGANGYPVINKIGDYTIIASLDNKTTESHFRVMG